MLFALALLGSASALTLEADAVLPPLGGSVTFRVSGGTPGAPYGLALSLAPASQPMGQGTLYLDAPKVVARGDLDGSGRALVTLTFPTNPAYDGRMVYFQAALPGGSLVLSNALSLRLGDRPDFRRSDAVAASPDGSKVYVAHARDGTVSIVDAVAHTLVGERAISALPGAGSLPLRAAVDPEGRHLYVVNPQVRTVGVIDVASDSVVALLPVAGASRDVAFAFGAEDRIYVTTERGDAVQVFREQPAGTFVAEPELPLAGSAPGPISLLADGRLVVAHRGSHELEILDPATGSTDARIPLGALPYELVVEGNRALVPSFDIDGGGDGTNVVLEVHLPTGTLLGARLTNVGTDYADLVRGPTGTAVVASGSGSLVIADPNLDPLGVVDLAPQAPVATPTAAALAGDQVAVVETFRETVSFVDLAAGPPWTVGAEVPLAWIGRPLIPLVDLLPEEDGEWFFRSVELFNGGPFDPNPVTCATCHPYGGSDGLVRGSGRQPLPMYRCGDTAPYGSFGRDDDLLGVVAGAAQGHNELGLPTFPNGPELIVTWLEVSNPPPVSPWLEDDGSLSPAAARGKVVFEGVAACDDCHTAPLFIPVPPAPLTIPGGVGTGLAPANVPTLLGIWASPPYLHDGSARTLLQVLTENVGDQHGFTSGLSASELQDLSAYVASL